MLTDYPVIPCCPIVHYVIKLGSVQSLHTLCQRMAQPGHSFSFFGPYHVQAGVCVFSLVLAWNSSISFYRFYPLLLWGCSVWTNLETIFLVVAMRIHQHDAPCDIVLHALLQDNSGCKREQHCGSRLSVPVMFITLTFYMVAKPIVCN